MIRHLLLALAVAAAAATAQEQRPPAVGSIEGAVTMLGTATPMPNVEVCVQCNTPKAVKAVTDAEGRYTLRGVEPGQLRVSANAPSANGRIGFGANATRQVMLQPGQELTSFDFRLAVPGQISGKVFDQNKEPVPGISVLLVSREYVAGVLRAVITSSAATDDQGEYQLDRVQPGRAYLVLAKRRFSSLDPISDAPAEPALRRPAVMPTYYPNSRSMEGAQPLTVGPNERREGVDIRLVRTPSFCLDGMIDGGAGQSKLFFEITEAQPASGIHESGGSYMAVPNGTAPADGKLRICDLHPGDYELAVRAARDGARETPFFGTTIVTIADRDLQNVRVTPRPRLPVAGEVVWDGPAPDPPLEPKLSIRVEALSRTEYGGVQAAIPGPFEFQDGLVMDDFRLQVLNVPKGVYVKEVTYGDRSILQEPLRVGRAMGNSGVQVVLARNGGTVTAKVLDKDGNPVADCGIVVMPASAASDGAFAAALLTGGTDQAGRWTSASLAPGKYYALATNDVINKTPETIAKLLAARSRAQEFDVNPNGSPTLNLTVVSQL